MGMTTAAATDLLTLMFINTGWANIGDATGLVPSTADGVFYISLHTSDPGVGGSQTTNECAYTSYARVSRARGAAQWTVTGDTVVTDTDTTFPTATGGSETATHVGIGTDASGAGNLLVSAALSASLLIENGVIPEFTAGDLACSVT